MEIIITNHAQRQLKKLSEQARQELRPAILKLSDWPEVENVKKLKGRPDYRLRVGRYRVIFEFFEGDMHVTQIVLRDDSTYT